METSLVPGWARLAAISSLTRVFGLCRIYKQARQFAQCICRRRRQIKEVRIWHAYCFMKKWRDYCDSARFTTGSLWRSSAASSRALLSDAGAVSSGCILCLLTLRQLCKIRGNRRRRRGFATSRMTGPASGARRRTAVFAIWTRQGKQCVTRLHSRESRRWRSPPLGAMYGSVHSRMAICKPLAEMLGGASNIATTAAFASYGRNPSTCT